MHDLVGDEAEPVAVTREAGKPHYRRTGVDWLLNSLAAAIAAFALAIALSGLFAWLGPGGLVPVNKYQLNMWIVPPIWLVFASLALNFSRGWHAWAWLGAANLLAWGILFAVQAAGP